MPTAIIWGYVLVSMSATTPETAPWMTFDYKTENLCEIDRAALVETVPDRQAWCIAVPKPESAPQRKRVVRTRARR